MLVWYLLWWSTREVASIAVERFVLVDPDTNGDVTVLRDGVNYLGSFDPSRSNIRADVDGDVVSVELTLVGISTRNEGAKPYTLFGDANGDYYDGSLDLKTWYTLIGTPHIYFATDHTDTGPGLKVDFFLQQGTVSPTISPGPTAEPSVWTMTPSGSPAPTSWTSPRVYHEIFTCVKEKIVGFPLNDVAKYIATATLTVDLQGDLGSKNEYADISINGVGLTTCGLEENNDLRDCDGVVRCLDSRDVTDFARSSGRLDMTLAASDWVGPHCGTAEGSYYALKAEVTLVVTLSGTVYPTAMPTTSEPSSVPTSTPGPSATPGPTASPVPTVAPTSALSTFSGLRGSLLAAQGIIDVEGIISFDERLDLYHVTRYVRGTGAIFDAGGVTALFKLEKASVLTLEDLTLRNGWTNSTGGCVQICDGSLVTLIRTTISDCSSLYGGAFLLDGSRLDIIDSLFRTNAALISGGAMYLENHSTVTTLGSTFRDNTAMERGGVLYVEDGSSMMADNSKFLDNSAGKGGGVAVVRGSVLSLQGCHVHGNDVREKGGVAQVWTGSIFTATNTSFHMNSAGDIAGCMHVATSSHFIINDCRFIDNSAGFRSGVIHVASKGMVTCSKSEFIGNTAMKDDGGVGRIASQGSFTATESSFERNSALNEGGVFHVFKNSKFSASKCSFRQNQAGIDGGVAFVERSSKFQATLSLFTENIATDAAVAEVDVDSTLDASHCRFLRNHASSDAGVAQVRHTSTFHAVNSSFVENTAGESGGALKVMDSSTAKVSDSEFFADFATKGDVLFVASSSSAEMNHSKFRGNGDEAVRCEGTGTIYAAHLDIELTKGLFTLDPNCVLFLYLSNNNGSAAYRKTVIGRNAVDLSRASVNFIHWSYPCSAGRWSPDGIEHGNTKDYVDGNNITINKNDQFCDDDTNSPELPNCADRCKTCPGGKYLTPTLNRYLHLGESSCAECPVGRSLKDESQEWWLHDSPDDCTPCAPGRYASEPGSSECKSCHIGRFAAEEGAIACTFVDPGFVASEDGASVPVTCKPGSFSVGGETNCTLCPIGEFQPEAGQASCKACPFCSVFAKSLTFYPSLLDFIFFF